MNSLRELKCRERRADERYGVHLRAMVRAYRMSPLPVELVDISAGGALLQADHPELMVGDEVTVEAGAFQAVATIAWSLDAFFGVSFHRRLTEWQLAGIRRTSNA